MPDLALSRSDLIDDETIHFVSRQMRGIRNAVVRFIGETPDYEAGFLDLLLALGVSAESRRMRDLAPQPKCRIGIQFKGTSAVITVDPSLPLHG